MASQSSPSGKPLVLITGAGGRIGGKLTEVLSTDYTVIGFDLEAGEGIIACDLSSDESVSEALAELRAEHGDAIAAVVHLAAFFDFTGEDNPLYRKVNVEGTRRLLRHLKDFAVERFLYASTMLVHAPGEPGDLVSESTPIDPRWAYPKSKAEAEAAIAEEAGAIPYTLLRLAGVYDEQSVVPTLGHQIARIYERDFQGRLYAGDLEAGQSFLHADDMADAIRRAVDRRKELDPAGAILIGEPGALGYAELQSRIGGLIHGEDEWATLSLPKPIAKVGAAVQEALEPVVPDSIDQGEAPFIKPFMIDMASDHYALDIAHARAVLGWEPRHRLGTVLPRLIASLKDDPLGFYKANKLTPPPWMVEADAHDADPETIRSAHEADYRATHGKFLWAHFATAFLGLWLVFSPVTLGYGETAMTVSDIVSGVALLVLGLASLNWRMPLARFAAGAVGLWVLHAPLVFWSADAAAYLNGTLVGALAVGFAVVSRPFPFVSPIATQTGPDIPPGWDFSPSTFAQRAPIIGLAVIGFFLSRYMAAYQLGHIEGVWDPFFSAPSGNPRNGTEWIITSDVSEAFPVPDAGLGATVYLIEIITGLIGTSRRWRTIPWMVVLFGLLIVPLGIVSITFIIIQPIVLGTWCFICLAAAAAMVIQIPYSLDELLATGQFLNRQRKKGALARAFLFGETDEGDRRETDDFEAPLRDQLRRMAGGVTLYWPLLAAAGVGIWLMLTRLTLGAEGAMADADHLIGALVIVVSITALAEVARPVRFLNILLGAALVVAPFLLDAGVVQTVAGIVAGVLISVLSVPRGAIEGKYGDWNRLIV